MQGLWSLIGKIGTGAAQNFPYEIGEKAGSLVDKSVWTLHEGKKKVGCPSVISVSLCGCLGRGMKRNFLLCLKGTGEAVSVFIHDVKSSSEDKVPQTLPVHAHLSWFN